LILNAKKIGTPPPKVETIDIPGGDGVLDLTDFFDGVKYKNRKLTFEFSTIVPRTQFMDVFTRVQNLLHGQRMDIQPSDDSWYYTGRVSVNEWKADKSVGTFTVECDCDPYKHRYTAQSVRLTGSNLINLAAGTMTTAEWVKTATGYTFSRSTTTAGSFVHFAVPVARGKQYRFAADYSGSTRLLYVYSDRLFGNLIAKADSGGACVFTAPTSGVYLFGLYVTSAANDGTFANVVLTEGAEAVPYAAYDTAIKTVTATFANTRLQAVPTVYATSALTVENGHNFATLSAGENVLPEFAFTMGTNTLTFKGNGVAVVEWREGAL
jgi:hypothetical protein